jgi:hypothetical protein
MTLSAEELRSFIEDEMDRRGTNPNALASRCPAPDGSTGISTSACYLAMDDEGEGRAGTLLRMAQALGFSVERTYTLRNLGIMERRRLHDDEDE